MLTAIFVIEHNDSQGQDGPINIDIVANGTCCAHEVAIFECLQQFSAELLKTPSNKLPTLDEAAAKLFIHSLKTGNKFTKKG